jgi:hypothetical protein
MKQSLEVTIKTSISSLECKRVKCEVRGMSVSENCLIRSENYRKDLSPP